MARRPTKRGIVVLPLRVDGAVALVDIATGVVTPIPAEPDRHLVAPLWVNDRDVWLVGSSVMPGQPGYPVFSTIVKLSRSHLAYP